MEIDEIAARLLRQYWAVVLVCVILPVAAIGLIAHRQPDTYLADARIITGSVVPASATQSQAIVSQVQAIATGPHTAEAALATAGVRRNLVSFINNDVTVTGLGGSQVVDVLVTDQNPAAAQRIAQALANAVTTSLNHTGQGGITSALHSIDKELVALSQQRAVLATEVTRHPHDQGLSAKLAGLDQVIANFTGDRGRLLIQATTQGLAGIIDAPAFPTRPQSKALPQKLALAGLLGLVVAILIAALAEVARPTVPGAQRVGRRLGAPTLGRLSAADLDGDATPGVVQLAFRTRLAALHASVSTVAVADASTGRDLTELAASLQWVLSDTGSHRAGSAEVAVTGNGSGPETGGWVALPPGAPGTGGTAVLAHPSTLTGPALKITLLSDMRPEGSGWDRVGLLIICGPVTRVPDVVTLADLAQSSGWPVLGVTAVPRARRRLFRAWRPARRGGQDQ